MERPEGQGLCFLRVTQQREGYLPQRCPVAKPSETPWEFGKKYIDFSQDFRVYLVCASFLCVVCIKATRMELKRLLLHFTSLLVLCI